MNVRGFHAWSLVDSFEWSAGYTPRFGLAFVDFSSAARERSVKTSACWLSALARANALVDPAPFIALKERKVEHRPTFRQMLEGRGQMALWQRVRARAPEPAPVSAPRLTAAVRAAPPTRAAARPWRRRQGYADDDTQLLGMCNLYMSTSNPLSWAIFSDKFVDEIFLALGVVIVACMCVFVNRFIVLDARACFRMHGRRHARIVERVEVRGDGGHASHAPGVAARAAGTGARDRSSAAGPSAEPEDGNGVYREMLG